MAPPRPCTAGRPRVLQHAKRMPRSCSAGVRKASSAVKAQRLPRHQRSRGGVLGCVHARNALAGGTASSPNNSTTPASCPVDSSQACACYACTRAMRTNAIMQRMSFCERAEPACRPQLLEFKQLPILQQCMRVNGSHTGCCQNVIGGAELSQLRASWCDCL